MQKRGFIFSYDSFLALIMFVLITLLIYFFFIYSVPTTQQYFFSEDLVNVLGSVKISELQENYPEVNEMIADGRIKNTDSTVIEQMSTFVLENNCDDARYLFNAVKRNLLPEQYEASFGIGSGRSAQDCGKSLSEDLINIVSRNRISVGRIQA